jgi:7-dehydrocholesterol reductase
MYTLCTRILVHTPGQFSWFSATAIFAIGLLGIAFNYAVDWERQYFRETGGKKKIWGRLPTKLDVKYFVTQGGKQVEKTSTLLTSGFWGISRHTNYVFELQLAYAWCFLSCSENYIGLFYPIFLTCLLFHRSVRDELKCINKYGEGYRQYMNLVRYRVLPFIF